MTMEYQEFISLGPVVVADAQEYGLAMRLETQPSSTDGRVHTFGCLLDESLAWEFLRQLSSAVEDKWGQPSSEIHLDRLFELSSLYQSTIKVRIEIEPLSICDSNLCR